MMTELEKKIARYKAGRQAAHEFWFALCRAKLDMEAIREKRCPDIDERARVLNEALSAYRKLDDAYIALYEEKFNTPSEIGGNKNRERMQLSWLRYYFLLKKLEAKMA